MVPMGDALMEQIRDRCRSCYEGNAHGWDHACRVASLARRLAQRVGADENAAEALGYLHDMARQRESQGEVACHAQAGAEMACELLDELGVDPALSQDMVSSIKTHRASANLDAKSVLAALLQDADRLDAIGAVAVARVFVRAGRKGTPLHDPMKPPRPSYNGISATAINHFHEKILRLTPDTFHTAEAQRIAVERHRFVKEYVRRFLEEWDALV